MLASQSPPRALHRTSSPVPSFPNGGLEHRQESAAHEGQPEVVYLGGKSRGPGGGFLGSVRSKSLLIQLEIIVNGDRSSSDLLDRGIIRLVVALGLDCKVWARNDLV